VPGPFVEAGAVPTVSTGSSGTLGGATAVDTGAVVSMGAGGAALPPLDGASTGDALAAIGGSAATGREVTLGVGAVSRPRMKPVPTRTAAMPTRRPVACCGAEGRHDSIARTADASGGGDGSIARTVDAGCGGGGGGEGACCTGRSPDLSGVARATASSGTGSADSKCCSSDGVASEGTGAGVATSGAGAGVSGTAASASGASADPGAAATATNASDPGAKDDPASSGAFADASASATGGGGDVAERAPGNGGGIAAWRVAGTGAVDSCRAAMLAVSGSGIAATLGGRGARDVETEDGALPAMARGRGARTGSSGRFDGRSGGGSFEGGRAPAGAGVDGATDRRAADGSGGGTDRDAFAAAGASGGSTGGDGFAAAIADGAVDGFAVCRVEGPAEANEPDAG
jgi:hypothetical protein